MRPVTDSHKISRPKLAYLIDATAAPVCMIAPISSWAAAVSSTAEGLNTGMSGIELFIRAIPYNLYSLMTFVFIIAIILMKFDYGPMKHMKRRPPPAIFPRSKGKKARSSTPRVICLTSFSRSLF